MKKLGSTTNMNKTFAYVISHKKISLYIAIVDIEKLHTHEEIIPVFLKKLTRSIQEDDYLYNPIIVDTKSFVVLDGMHRIAALKKLRCKRIPICMVNYENPNIKVGCWYRVIIGTDALKQITKKIKETKLVLEEIKHDTTDNLGKSPIVAVIKSRKQSFLLKHKYDNLKQAYEFILNIEKRIKN